jgi:hypothetical protein
MRGDFLGLPAAAQPDETDPEGSSLALFILHNMQHVVATWPLAGLLLWWEEETQNNTNTE